MTTGYTTANRLGKPEVGADEDAWGTILNATMDMVDEAVGGYVSLSVAGGNVTLSTANNATDQARNAIIKFTGSPGTDRTITAPDVEKTYWLINGVGDTSNILFKATGGSTVTIPAGHRAKVYTDGATNAVILFLYGENTWTPIFLGSGTAGTGTYATQLGTYTRNGRLVTAHFELSASSLGTATNNLLLGGLPFTVNGTYRGGLVVHEWTGFNLAANYGYIGGTTIASGTTARFMRNGITTNNATAILIASDIAGTITVVGTVTYHV